MMPLNAKARRRAGAKKSDTGTRGPVARGRPGVQATILTVLMLMGLFLGASSAGALGIRWSTSSNRIYVTGPGFVTLSDISAAQIQAPLKQVTPGVWYLMANLVLEDGAHLILQGTRAGGDVDELRLQIGRASCRERV